MLQNDARMLRGGLIDQHGNLIVRCGQVDDLPDGESHHQHAQDVPALADGTGNPHDPPAGGLAQKYGREFGFRDCFNLAGFRGPPAGREVLRAAVEIRPPGVVMADGVALGPTSQTHAAGVAHQPTGDRQLPVGMGEPRGFADFDQPPLQLRGGRIGLLRHCLLVLFFHAFNFGLPSGSEAICWSRPCHSSA